MSFKLTVIIDKAKWEQFKLWANKRGSNASEQINQYIDNCLAGLYDTDDTDTTSEREQQEELWSLAQAKIEQSISELRDYVDTQTEGLIASAVKIAGDYTDERIDFYRQMGGGLGKPSYLSSTTDDTDDTDNTDDTDDTDDTDKDIKPIHTDDTDNTDNKTYTDKEVAQAEGKTRETIRRYRKDERKPKDSTFWQRWKPTENKEAWLEKNA